MSPADPGTTAILQWVEEAGLGIVPGLGDAFMAKAGSLDALTAMSDDDFQAVISSLKLRGISLRKVTAAFKTLQSNDLSKPSAFEVRSYHEQHHLSAPAQSSPPFPWSGPHMWELRVLHTSPRTPRTQHSQAHTASYHDTLARPRCITLAMDRVGFSHLRKPRQRLLIPTVSSPPQNHLPCGVTKPPMPQRRSP